MFPTGGFDLARLPHAMLLSGSAGLGKDHFARQLALRLLCESPAGEGHFACGKCLACHWMSDGNHPDFRLLSVSDEDADGDPAAETKEKKKGATQIKIGAVRALEDFVFVGSHRHGNRVVVIEQAHAMNGPAANALLKILEEPPPSVYFILTTSKPRALLATVRSRCQVIQFTALPATDWPSVAKVLGLSANALADLALAGGAPLTLQRWEKEGILPVLKEVSKSLRADGPMDPLALASIWDGLLKKHPTLDMELLVEQVLRWVFDVALSSSSQGVRYHTQVPMGATSTSATKKWSELLQFRRSARHPLNQTLFLENLAAHTLRALRSST